MPEEAAFCYTVCEKSGLNLGAGASTWVGPAIVGLCLASVGVKGVMWIFSVLYLISAALTLFLTLRKERT